jgi:hypothetical protein
MKRYTLKLPLAYFIQDETACIKKGSTFGRLLGQPPLMK